MIGVGAACTQMDSFALCLSHINTFEGYFLFLLFLCLFSKEKYRLRLETSSKVKTDVLFLSVVINERR